jgi:hypothetical protein
MANFGKVREQILAVRATGRSNMFDVTAVQRIAFEMGFHELVDFIETDRRAYGAFILTGAEPDGEPEPVYPVSREKCAGCRSCALVTETITGAPVTPVYYQCLAGVESDCRGE